MSLKNLLTERGVHTALIVDDAFDTVPKASDIADADQVWPTFNDDLTAEQKALIVAAYPLAASTRFDVLFTTDDYVAAVWGLRDTLGPVAEAVFATYGGDQADDQRYVDLARRRLEAVGLTCTTAGREFLEPALTADLIVIDLFLGQGQDERALERSKTTLAKAVGLRAASPPLVVLMSRSHRLQDKRNDFRDQVGLIDSAFRILRKSDLDTDGVLELQLERLAENLEDTRLLVSFVDAIDKGLDGAVKRTLTLLRKLKLSDVGQIQDLLLSAEGEPTGSYLVDVFDRVLQHEIEDDEGIINAAKALNAFKAAKHPPPFLAGSPDLQQLVSRLVTQNNRRLELPGSLKSPVTFGDLLRLPADAGPDTSKVFADLGPHHVLVVLTPVCDLQRADAPRVFLLVGEVQDANPAAWSYGPDLRTPAIKLDGELCWIKWNLKHVATAPGVVLAQHLEAGTLRLVGRLRESHALEIQQRVLSGLGRVGQIAPLPATFLVDLEVYYAGLDGKPSRLDPPDLNEGAVCWVGRDAEGDPLIRLVMTEWAVEGVANGLANIPREAVAEAARTAFDHVVATPDLRRKLTAGLDLKGVGDKEWRLIKSETGDKAVPNMGLLAWNLPTPEVALQKGQLNKAGVILLIKDRDPGAPGLGDAQRTGALAPQAEAKPAAEAPEDDGPAAVPAFCPHEA